MFSYRCTLLALTLVAFSAQISAVEYDEQKKELKLSEKSDLMLGLDFSDIFPKMANLNIIPDYNIPDYNISIYENANDDMGLSKNPNLKSIFYVENSFENILLYSHLPKLEDLSGFPTFDQTTDWSSLPTFSKLKRIFFMNTQGTNLDSLFENIGASTSIKSVRLVFDGYACFAKNTEGSFSPSNTFRSSLKEQILSLKNLDELDIAVVGYPSAEEVRDFKELERNFKNNNPKTKVKIGIYYRDNNPGGG